MNDAEPVDLDGRCKALLSVDIVTMTAVVCATPLPCPRHPGDCYV